MGWLEGEVRSPSKFLFIPGLGGFVGVSVSLGLKTNLPTANKDVFDPEGSSPASVAPALRPCQEAVILSDMIVVRQRQLGGFLAESDRRRRGRRDAAFALTRAGLAPRRRGSE